MALFALVSDVANPALDAKIIADYPEGDRYRLNDRAWVISADKLVQKIGEDLGVSSGGAGRVVIFGITPAHFGWHDKALWEWLSLKAAK